MVIFQRNILFEEERFSPLGETGEGCLDLTQIVVIARRVGLFLSHRGEGMELTSFL